jgi:hypothetical protein
MRPKTKPKVSGQKAIRSRRRSRKQLETVAFHEAGHAVVRLLIGYVLEEVAIFDVPNDAGELGHAQGSGCCEPHEEILALLARTVAQAMFLNKPFSLHLLSKNYFDHVDVLKVFKAIHDYGPGQQSKVIEAHILASGTYFVKSIHIARRRNRRDLQYRSRGRGKHCPPSLG